MDARCAHRHGPQEGHPGGPQPGPADLPKRRSPLAAYAPVGQQQGSRLRPKRASIVGLYTAPPEGATVLCVDELGPVTPRNFPPAPGWSPDGHRIKVPLELRPRTTESLGVWSAAGPRWAGADANGARTQYERAIWSCCRRWTGRIRRETST